MVLRDKESGKSRGFGFVTIEDTEAVDKLLQVEHTLDGRSLTVRRAAQKNTQEGGGGGGGGACGMNMMGGGGMGMPMGGGMGGGMPMGGGMGGMPMGGGMGMPMGGGGGGGGMAHAAGDTVFERKIFLGGVDTGMTEAAVRLALSARRARRALDDEQPREHARRPRLRLQLRQARRRAEAPSDGADGDRRRQINISRATPKGTKQRGGRGGGGRHGRAAEAAACGRAEEAAAGVAAAAGWAGWAAAGRAAAVAPSHPKPWAV